jgi:hypothetical protein
MVRRARERGVRLVGNRRDGYQAVQTAVISGACVVLAAALTVAPSALSRESVDCIAYVARVERVVKDQPAAAEVLASDLDDGALRREADACIPIRKLVFQIRHQTGDPCSAGFPQPVVSGPA